MVQSNAALDTGAAEAYDKHIVPALNAPVAGKIVELAALQSGERVVDVACGTGVVAGLAEIRRVMSTRARLVAAVWTRLEDCSGQLALTRALERRKVDATPIRKAYSFGDPQRIRELAAGAGFRDVEIRMGSTIARYASARAFVEAFAADSFSSRAAISRVPEDRRSEFLDEIECELREYEAGNGVELPLGYLVLIARS